jgi:hypothetical protein
MTIPFNLELYICHTAPGLLLLGLRPCNDLVDKLRAHFNTMVLYSKNP